jgi:hypothetical protein
VDLVLNPKGYVKPLKCFEHEVTQLSLCCGKMTCGEPVVGEKFKMNHCRL